MASLASSQVRAGKAAMLRPGNHRAKVTAAPASTDDPVTVRLLTESRENRAVVDNWAPNGTSLPAVGDVALVTADDQGYLWIVAWMAA